jgi:hypothetical protein
MLKTSMLALATVVALGAAPAAYASDHEESGGYDIGPLGQCFAPPDCGGQASRARAYVPGFYRYGYVPDHRYHRERDWHRAR